MPEVRGWLAHATGTKDVMYREHPELAGEAQWDGAVEVTLLVNWEKQHQDGGGRLVLDWETLRMRAQGARPRPRPAS